MNPENSEQVLELLRRFFDDSDNHVTTLDHPGEDDNATVFMVIDRAAWFTRDEADAILEALGLNKRVERKQ